MTLPTQIATVTGEIQGAGGGPGTLVTAFDGDTFWRTVRANYDILYELKNTYSEYELYAVSVETFVYDNTVYYWVGLVLRGESNGEESFPEITLHYDGEGFSLASLGITANDTPNANDVILLTEYTVTSYSQILGLEGSIVDDGQSAGNISAFNGNTFWTILNQDPGFVELIEYELDAYPDSLPEFVGVAYYANEGMWYAVLGMTSGAYYTLASNDAQAVSSYTLAELGITANLVNDGYDMVYLFPTSGTPPPTPPPPVGEGPILYGSVNNLSTRIKKLYGSINGQSRKISKLYASVDGFSRLIFEDSSISPVTLQYKLTSTQSWTTYGTYDTAQELEAAIATLRSNQTQLYDIRLQGAT